MRTTLLVLVWGSLAFAHQVGVRVPFALKHFDRATPGFSNSNYDPPYEIEGRLDLPLAPSETLATIIFLQASTALVKPIQTPILGIGGGVLLDWLTARAELGASMQFQNALSKAPFEGSQFDVTTVFLWTDGQMPLGFFTPGLRLGYLSPDDGKTSTQEGLETHSRHGATYLFEPRVRVGLAILDLEARLGLWSLGATAIANKEFAFGIPRKTVLRWGLGAGIKIGEIETWARASFLGNVDDIEEHYQQAPFLTGVNLLAPQTLSLEATWRF